MAFIGMNVSRDGSLAPPEIRRSGATWVRIVAMPEIDLRGYCVRCHQAGLRVLLVIAHESCGELADPLGEYATRYTGYIDAVQIGNEPDLHSPSSWTMDQGTFVQWGWLAAEAFPSLPILTAGMASGQPDWLQGVDLSWADAIAVHPYLKDAPNDRDIEDLQDIPVLLDAYRQFGLPLVVTEWGWWGSEEKRGGEEVADMIQWAAHTDMIEGFFYFCWTDAMVAPFGLLREDGSRKSAYSVFERYAPLAINPPWPPAKKPEDLVIPEKPVTETAAWAKLWKAIDPKLEYNDTIAEWGIPTYWRQHLRELGSPLGPEMPLGDGAMIQAFALGIVKWTGASVERVA